MQLILDVQNISKTYGRGESSVRAVRDASFSLEEGELLLVMGPSGSGKTTLLLMCGTLLRPDAGRILLDGRDITRMNEAALPPVRLRKVGFIFQQFNLLHGFTALENVEIVLNAAGVKGSKARTMALQALDRVGLSDRATHIPEDLSAGEKQRAAVARALANSPRLIIADEPTGNLDSKAGGDVIEMIRGIVNVGKKAAIVASHDQRIQSQADRVLMMEDGRLNS